MSSRSRSGYPASTSSNVAPLAICSTITDTGVRMARMKPFRRALRLGFCPSCHAKRAVVWAEWLATEVLAKVEHRPSLDKLLSGAHGFLRVVGPAFRQPEPTTGNPEHLRPHRGRTVLRSPAKFRYRSVDPPRPPVGDGGPGRRPRTGARFLTRPTLHESIVFMDTRRAMRRSPRRVGQPATARQNRSSRARHNWQHAPGT